MCEAQTFSARRLLLISAPSRRVCRSALDVSAPRSFPARSMRENLPCILPLLRRIIWNTAWLRDEWALAEVCPDVLRKTTYKNDYGCVNNSTGGKKLSDWSNLQLLPISMSLSTSSVHLTSRSCSPTTWTCCFPSSRTRSFAFLFRRSNTCTDVSNRLYALYEY